MKNRKIIQHDFKISQNKHFEGAMTQGNGYINVRASFEEDLTMELQDETYWRLPANVTLEKIKNPTSKWGVYIPGIYGLHPILGEEIVNLPYFLGINLYCENEKFDMGDSIYTDYEKTLDMNNGVLKRKLIWQTEKGNVTVSWKRWLSMDEPHGMKQTISLDSDTDMEIMVENFIDGDVTTNGYCHFTSWDCDQNDGLMMEVTLDSEQKVRMKTYSELKGAKIITTAYEKIRQRISEYKQIKLKAGQTAEYDKYGLVVTSLDVSSNEKLSEQMNELHSEISGAGGLSLNKHEEKWVNLWESSEVHIIGDDALSECLDFSIYHLLRAANLSWNTAIDAKGFAGEAYFGHYFWDTEIYLLPFYNSTQPEQAKRLVKYRYQMLNGAKKNAENYGYPGAKYPWESCATGLEQCSNWQYADLEIHVNADVVFGIWSYYQMTGDKKFLLSKGLKIMVETARYWMERVVEDKDGYHINGVMGPDEYLPFSNDNAFTNYMVKFALEKTVETLQMLPDDKKQFFGVDKTEQKLFQKVSKGLVIHKNEAEDFIWQCKNFEDYEELDFRKFWNNKNKPFGSQISQERNYRSKALKQADVASLLYLFENDFDETTIKNCMKYYEPYTTHDSSLSYIIHALVYARLGEIEKSNEFVKKSMNIDWGNFGAAEGIHIANAGGLWQGVVKGFGGFCGIDEAGHPVIKPRLPKHIKKIQYQLMIKGIRYQISVEDEMVEKKILER